MKVETIKQSFEVMTPKSVYKGFIPFLERVGRVCYKSEGRIEEGSGEKILRRIIKSGHESVIEHANITIRFTTDRAMTHCLVRHRHCAFSQESTHFINYNKKGLQVIQQVGLDKEENFENWLIWNDFMESLGTSYEDIDHNKDLFARSILPNAFKTELVMTANLREWRHILKVRTGKSCHPQMRDLMLPVLAWFKKELPLFVEDIDG